MTDLLSQDVPLEDVQYLAGHANPKTTQIYDRSRRRVTRNSEELGQRFDGGKKLIPDEQLPALIQRLSQPSVKLSAFNRYLNYCLQSDRKEIEDSVRSLLRKKISITSDS